MLLIDSFFPVSSSTLLPKSKWSFHPSFAFGPAIFPTQVLLVGCLVRNGCCEGILGHQNLWKYLLMVTEGIAIFHICRSLLLSHVDPENWLNGFVTCQSCSWKSVTPKLEYEYCKWLVNLEYLCLLFSSNSVFISFSFFP